jgi:nitrogen fixation protein NifB
MSPKVATARVISEIRKDSRIKIVAVSGPGEPLANPETFDTIEIIRDNLDEVHLCLSTNGTLLEDNVQWLVKMDFKTLTVSMSTANPTTASRIYEWASVGGHILTGEKMGAFLVDAQLRGISKAADAGIAVKVNTILIPSINQDDIISLAQIIADAGASLQNIIPLVPNDHLSMLEPPGIDLLTTIRNQAASYINQFRHCKQCRSDVVGLPGCDVIL